MSLAFRNVTADPAEPVASWPYEALVTAIERGLVADWARITAEIGREPWGAVARQVEEYLSYERPYGVAPLLDRAIARSRAAAEEGERAAVAADVRDLVRRSGLDREEFARRVGTSRSRLSTYAGGSVTPSAALVERMRQLVRRIEAAPPPR